MAAYLHEVASLYARVHALGILHADVQPLRVIGTQRGLMILDWELARTFATLNPWFEWSFVHYASPEVASDMLAKKGVVRYSISFEIYSLGAVMLFFMSGKTPVDYGAEDSRSVPMGEKLAAIAEGKLREMPKEDSWGGPFAHRGNSRMPRRRRRRRRRETLRLDGSSRRRTAECRGRTGREMT
jgi:serine/threonine protein kinase